MKVVHSPPNTISHIETIWAVVSVDATGEGICGAMIGGQWLSLTTASEHLVPSIMDLARDVSKITGKRLRLIKMTAREDIEEIG